MRGPSARQLEVLRFIADTLDAKGFPPTLREVCVMLGASSTYAAHGHITALVRHGLLERQPASARALRVTALGADALAR